MIDIQTLTEVVQSQKKIILAKPEGIKREKLKAVTLKPGFASLISGIRRCGKSTLMRQLIGESGEFNYINLEDVRLSGFELEDFRKLEKIFSPSSGAIWFFDEIQNVQKWEKYIRTLVDRGETVVLTGSNASLLSRELGTKMTGRHLDTELLPFSFSEYCDFFHREQSASSYEEYLLKGGFPEYLKTGELQIHQTLFTDVIIRDVIYRHGLRDEKLVRELALYLATNVGKEYSFNSLKKIFSAGSVNTIISMINYLEDSYLFFTVHRFSYSYKKRLLAPKKIYCVDTGLITSNTASFSADKGRLLENAVYLQLRRNYKDIFYFNDERECDFIVRDGKGNLFALQVAWQLNEDNLNRELQGLVIALDKLQLSEGAIITLGQEDEFSIAGKKIKAMPVWKWPTLWKKANFAIHHF